MAAIYRVRQFVRAVRGPAQPPQLGPFAGFLTPPQHGLFAAMDKRDQHHCLAVAGALAESGQTDPDLLRAALLHDAGKSLAQIAVWERVAHVLLLSLAPGMVGRVGSPVGGGFGHGLYVLAHHAATGADLAAQAGCAAPTVALLRGEGDAAQLAALRVADDTH